MKTLISKIIVAVVIGTLWGVSIYFDLVRQYVPGFHCEGFGCVGLGFAYFIYIPIISFLVISFLAFITNKENKAKHIFVSLEIMVLVLTVMFLIENKFQELKIKKAVEISNSQDELFCEIDSDCIPFIFECGQCADYSVAINKNFKSKMQERYYGKCGENIRICDAVPKLGNVSCKLNRCVLDKNEI